MTRCMVGRADANRSLLVVETQKGPSMRFADSIFASLLKPIDRRQFARIVDEHDGDAYDKSFRSWDHLVALVYAQFGKVESLRALEAGFNANSQHHYHLGTGKLARSTLADANGRRPIAIFAQTFAMLAGAADRRTRQEGAVMVRLIDASPVPLHKACSWAPCNGRIRGMKLHVVYDPLADVPTAVAVTSATVNDIEIGRQTAIAAGATYVFDKGYCRFDWWQKINDRGAFFVTRPKRRMRLRALQHRTVHKPNGDGFTIMADDEVRGGLITLLSNDMARSAVEIAALYKSRWQIELLFRWIKQHLDIRKFLGTTANAIRLQILAAMIAYLLLRIAARINRVAMLALRFAELIRLLLFTRRSIAAIAQPPPTNPSYAKPRCSPDQLEFCYP